MKYLIICRLPFTVHCLRFDELTNFLICNFYDLNDLSDLICLWLRLRTQNNSVMLNGVIRVGFPEVNTLAVKGIVKQPAFVDLES